VLIARFGWRTSYIVIGAFVMLALVAIAQLLRRDPSHMGLLPDGDSRTEISGPNTTERGISLREAIRGRPFWTICFANIAIVSCLMVIMLQHRPTHNRPGLVHRHRSRNPGDDRRHQHGRATRHRHPPSTGSERGPASLVCFILFVSAFLCIQLAKEPWMLILFAIVYGFGHGGYFTLISPLVAERFGIRSHGVLSALSVCRNLRGGMGPVIAATSLTSPEATAPPSGSALPSSPLDSDFCCLSGKKPRPERDPSIPFDRFTVLSADERIRAIRWGMP